MDDAAIKKLVERELRWKVKNERNKVAARLLKEKIKAAGIVVSEQEIDAEIAKQGK
jgi:hypothetical protein